MSDLNELNCFLDENGKEGMRLLVPFSLLKSKVKARSKLYPNLDEKMLDRMCMRMASKLLRLGKDQPTENDVGELLRRLRRQ